uniref:Temporin-PTa n=1 Tax=Pulchrana picturata TaxID=395594 RepID=TPA_PULPI|nr:RecName: Full=Temporin-PTa [Pulchrana picturata]
FFGSVLKLIPKIL